MTLIKEPTQLVTCTDMVELIEAWHLYCSEMYHTGELSYEEVTEAKHRHDYHYEKAAKSLARFNRRTLSDS